MSREELAKLWASPVSPKPVGVLLLNGRPRSGFLRTAGGSYDKALVKLADMGPPRWVHVDRLHPTFEDAIAAAPRR